MRTTSTAEEQFDQTTDRLLLDRKIITDPDSYGYEKDAEVREDSGPRNRGSKPQ